MKPGVFELGLAGLLAVVDYGKAPSLRRSPSTVVVIHWKILWGRGALNTLAIGF